MSARTRSALWQRLALVLIALGALAALLIARVETIRVVTLALAALFVPVIALRLATLRGLMRREALAADAPLTRLADDSLPVYTILVPLYREAHMLPGLVLFDAARLAGGQARHQAHP